MSAGRWTRRKAGLRSWAAPVFLLGNLLPAADATAFGSPDAAVVSAAPDVLAARGIAVTGGAAPGYVEDRVCGPCHTEIALSYRETGMSRSFQRPSPEHAIEDFGDGRFFHAPSRRYYEMAWRDDGLYFSRYQLDAEGRQLNVFERRVDWILGSGHAARTYLYQTAAGELYQLPIAWYTQEGAWSMASGYDRPHHDGVTRRVGRDCMFCHNAYPETAAGSDLHAAPQTFPAELPEGIGCQRCHGPGADHARRAFSEGAAFDKIRAAIVNPAKLDPQRRNDLCDSCHLQPSRAFAGIRRFGRADYSFRPGEPLTDYLLQMDIDGEDRARAERFEINHHSYRLEQSPCFVASRGELDCLSCHDPHRLVPAGERAAHYRGVCMSCHVLETLVGTHGPATIPKADCVGCHMPSRRTQDWVHVTVTDHFIRRPAGGPELVAPLAESEPVVIRLELLDPGALPSSDLAELYRAAATARVAPSEASLRALNRVLGSVAPEEIEPYLDLVRGLLTIRGSAGAEAAADVGLERWPDHPLLLEWRGVARLLARKVDPAAADIRRALEIRPWRSEARFNLGLTLLSSGRAEEAIEELRHAVEGRPNQHAAWYYLGVAYDEIGRRREAAAAYRRALEIEPGHGRAYLALGKTLVEAGERREALRMLRHGIDNVDPAQPLREAIREALQNGGG